MLSVVFRLGCVLHCLVLITAKTEEFRCLQCTKDNALMCYNNQTCGGAAHKYCYHYKWDILSEELSTDLNNRAWGCTDSLDTCKKGCQDDQCTHFKCCYADVDFANNPALNWSDYEMCIYGRSEGSRAWGSWGLVGLVAGCHFISRTCLYQ